MDVESYPDDDIKRHLRREGQNEREMVAYGDTHFDRYRYRLLVSDACQYEHWKVDSPQELTAVFQQKGNVVENEDQKNRVTVRIEESGSDPAPAEAAPAADATEAHETRVVFVRDEEKMSACYLQGFHDASTFMNVIVFMLSAAIAFLVLSRNAAK
jgi:hypothetical protein